MDWELWDWTLCNHANWGYLPVIICPPLPNFFTSNTHTHTHIESVPFYFHKQAPVTCLHPQYAHCIQQTCMWILRHNLNWSCAPYWQFHSDKIRYILVASICIIGKKKNTRFFLHSSKTNQKVQMWPCTNMWKQEYWQQKTSVNEP